MKRLLFPLLFLTVVGISHGDPRNPLPQTPSQVWQNDLDLRDMINGRLSLNGSKYCIDNPTFCVDADNNRTVFEPTTAGDDSYIVFQTQGGVTTVWSIGLDNSDADQFKWSPSGDVGTSPVFIIAKDGIITKPLQPSFLATAPTNTANVTGDGTTFTIEYDNEIFDQNNDYNTSTFIFTAPITGRYLLQAAMVVQNTSAAAGHTSAVLSIVTSNRVFSASVQQVADSTQHLGTSAIADMDINDTAKVTIVVNGGTKVVEIFDSGDFSYFSGSLIN